MLILTVNHDFHYETENLLRVFYPHEKIELHHAADAAQSDGVEALITREGCWQRYLVSVHIRQKTLTRHTVGDVTDGADAELALCTLLFEVLCDFTGYTPAWGLLTGVRPAKLMGTLRHALGEEAAQSYFRNTLRVSDEKTALAARVSEKQDQIAALSSDGCFSLYLSIPFCPTRCSYCSFVSHSIEKAKKLLPDYTALLCEEIKCTARIAAALGLKLKSIYMGGGTPTTLSADQMHQVLTTVRESFDLSNCLEFTVEAGRPDTVDEEKLMVLRQNGVGRISINPQSFDDAVLRQIGRNHTSADTLRAYELAQKAGFEQINMDLIAGLPGDTPDGFAQSLDRAIALSPSNITVHTLALKRSSSLVYREGYTAESDTAAMLAYAQKQLPAFAYEPYYMYRQSRCVGNLENVGWAQRGSECLYNVFMMEEIHTVLSCGGGAVTKLKQDSVNNIERIFNFKYPYEYIDRFAEILARKDKIFAFYEHPERFQKGSV